MPLHPPLPIPERILVFGDAGSGKTTNALNIARWAHRTKSPARFHILDSDFAIPRMMTNYKELITRITLYPCYDWPDYTSAATAVMAKAQPTDWVICDFIGSAWQAVQAHFTTEVFKKTIGNYFLQVRKQLDAGSKSLGALEGWTDWQVINALYKQWINPLLFKGKYHIYATAKSSQLSSEKKPTEEKDIRQMFLRFGVKPTGQKDLPYQFHTVLISGYNLRTGNRTLTTVKDRERRELSGQECKNFAIDYLKDIAGWEM